MSSSGTEYDVNLVAISKLAAALENACLDAKVVAQKRARDAFTPPLYAPLACLALIAVIIKLALAVSRDVEDWMAPLRDLILLVLALALGVYLNFRRQKRQVRRFRFGRVASVVVQTTMMNTDD